MSKKCAICGDKIGFSEGKFISEKYVCKTCYGLNEKKKLGEPQEDDKDKYQMGRGLGLMSSSFNKK